MDGGAQNDPTPIPGLTVDEQTWLAEITLDARRAWGGLARFQAEPTASGWLATATGHAAGQVLFASETTRPKAVALLREYVHSTAATGRTPSLAHQVAAHLSSMDLGDALASLRAALNHVAARAISEEPMVAARLAKLSLEVGYIEVGRREGDRA